MGGILKNPLPDQNGHVEDSESISEFRKQVYKNTQLNAQLSSKNNNEKTQQPITPKKHSIPKDIVSLKHEQDILTQSEEQERLKWNQQNLDENDVAKLQYQDINIDEPKTPYQGAVDPSGEYYRDDEEEEDLESLSLGEPVVGLKNTNETQESREDEPSQEDEVEPESPEARHKRFEKLRKQHYNVKEALNAQKSGSHADDDDEE
ncbi:LANO_0C09208g1_1 [Lachancea nothofagi CBS 11611]|uniref:LANO_0C09208g1_1 n=1 Tax=Lachancea nothofagi CBS 11611 TaxID=1266666 RepID=A0A1G4J9U8_9SACH|nr:LANO_0C09208g1_1 [Lachancea nothofagi CBS 11611]